MKKKLKTEGINENELDQVRGGVRGRTTTDQDPKQFDRDEEPEKDSFFGSFPLLKPFSAENESVNETLSETENVSRVRSNNIRNRRV